jgi:hypothetical protein
MMKKRFLLSALILALLALCFMGCDDGGSGDNKKSDPTVLTISGIPAEVSIIAGTVVDLTTQAPVASGYLLNGSAKLYEPDANFMPSDKPWKGQGDYMVALAGLLPGKTMQDLTTDPENSTQQYVYVGFDTTALMTALAGVDLTDPMAMMTAFAQLSQNQALMAQLMGMGETMKVSFNKDASKSFAWNAFMPRELLEMIQDMASLFDGGDSNTVLTISGIPTEVTIIAGTVIDFTTTAPVATGPLLNGSVILYEPDANFVPDTTKPWKGEGNYMVALADGSMKQYVYVGFDTTELMTALAEVDLTGQTAIMEIGGILQQKPSLMASLGGMAESMAVSFAKDESKAFAWNAFMPRELLEMIQGMMAQMGG